MFRLIAQIIYMVLLFVETVISLRFVFKLLGAEDTNAFVNLIYSVSNTFVRPFRGIISGDWHVGRFYIDVDALIALIVYMIVAFVIVEIIRAFTNYPRKG